MRFFGRDKYVLSRKYICLLNTFLFVEVTLFENNCSRDMFICRGEQEQASEWEQVSAYEQVRIRASERVCEYVRYLSLYIYIYTYTYTYIFIYVRMRSF